MRTPRVHKSTMIIFTICQLRLSTREPSPLLPLAQMILPVFTMPLRPSVQFASQVARPCPLPPFSTNFTDNPPRFYHATTTTGAICKSGCLPMPPPPNYFKIYRKSSPFSRCRNDDLCGLQLRLPAHEPFPFLKTTQKILPDFTLALQ